MRFPRPYRGIAVFAAAVGLLLCVALSPVTSAAQSSGEDAQPDPRAELEELRAILGDDSLDEGERIDRALERIDERLAALRAGPEALVPSDPRALAPRGPRRLWNDPFFADPFHSPGQWDPFQEFQRMQEMTDRLFSDALQRFQHSPNYRGLVQDHVFQPSADLREEKDKYIVRMDLPGVDKTQIEVSVEKNVLTVSGERTEVVEEKDGEGQFLRRESRTGRFQRAIMLPGAVDETRVQARYEDGVLHIELPKTEDDQSTRTIIVK